LAELSTSIEAKDSNCLAVVKDGKLVTDERYRDFTPESRQEIFSATKSITSALAGIAQDQGKLTIDQPASTWLTEWKGTPSESVTVRNLLSNDSGRYYDFNTDYLQMAVQESDKSTFALGLSQQFPPGEHWEYNNSAIQTLSPLLERATGQDLDTFATANLFEPIGMDSEIRSDEAGNTLTFMGAQANCHDMARFGWLFANNGRWADTQVVSEAWVAESTSKASQQLNDSYAMLWWRNGVNAEGEKSWPDAPDDAFAALGLGEQTVLVLPTQHIVAVRLGLPPGGDNGQGRIVNEMAKAVMAANG
jgi:CubicO group peptidase (beta-lactamase class C family)